MNAFFSTTIAVLALVLAAGAPARAGDDEEECQAVVKDLEEAIAIANKNFDATMAELKKLMSGPADDRKRATVKNTFCNASGEMLGSSRVMRIAVAVCEPKKRAAIASIDKSIAEMETAIDNTCK